MIVVRRPFCYWRWSHNVITDEQRRQVYDETSAEIPPPDTNIGLHTRHHGMLYIINLLLSVPLLLLSSIVKTRRLSLLVFGHIARMNESTDASRILFEPPSEVWRKPRGRPRNSWVRTVTNDLANSYTGIPEAREAAQDRVYWRMFMKHSATHS